jgi:hypothetical protein
MIKENYGLCVSARNIAPSARKNQKALCGFGLAHIPNTTKSYREQPLAP